MPRSIQMTLRVRFSRKRRSWLMMTLAERICFSSLSSHSIAGRSRWFVGSSSRRMSGSGASTRAIAARAGFAAGDVVGVFFACEAQFFEEILGAIMAVARREAFLYIVKHSFQRRKGPAPAGKYRRVVPGWKKRSPLSGSTLSAAIFRSVDLPEPLRPTSAMEFPFMNGHFGPGQQCLTSNSQMNVLKVKERWCHEKSVRN